MKANRNDRCPCGSGKKYKHCCEGKTPWYRNATLTGLLILLVLVVTAAVVWNTVANTSSVDPNEGKVWSPEHGHYH